MTGKTKECTLTKLGWVVIAIPIIAFLAIIVINFFFPFYNNISLWIVVGKISFVVIIAYLLTRIEPAVFAIFLIAFTFIIIIHFFFTSYNYIILWIAGILMNATLISDYNGWLCKHNWIYLSELHRFCTNCHRLEMDTSYLSYGTYMFRHSPNVENLKKEYKKKDIVHFLSSYPFFSQNPSFVF